MRGAELGSRFREGANPFDGTLNFVRERGTQAMSSSRAELRRLGKLCLRLRKKSGAIQRKRLRTLANTSSPGMELISPRLYRS